MTTAKLLVFLILNWPTPTRSARTAADIPAAFLANKQCRIIISEINISSGDGLDFIELMRVCYPTPKNVYNVNMDKKFKLIFIDHSGFMVGVCDLKKEARRRSGKHVLYVVGGPKVKNVDMPLSDCEFASDTDGYGLNILPPSYKAPVSVLLVHHPKGLLSPLTLQQEGIRKLKRPITNDLEEKIIPLVIDMYIYTTSAPFTSCDYFGTYYDGYKRDRQVILRDWSPYALDRTLSRCSPPEDVPAHKAWEPLQPTYFKHAKSTPGDVNDCKTAVAFRIEDTQPQRDAPIVKFSTTPEYACYITTVDPIMDHLLMITTAGNYYARLKALIDEAESSVGNLDDASFPIIPLNPNDPSRPNPMDQSLFERELEKSSPHTWQDCENFKHKDFISERRSDKNSYVNPEHILRKDVCNWLEYIAPHSFRCKLCHALWNQQIIFDRPGSSLLTAVKKERAFRTGQSSSIPFKNKILIDDHSNGEMHQISLDYIQLIDQKKRATELEAEFYRGEGPFRKFLRPTELAFVAVFQSTRMDIPFYKYPLMAQTLTFYDVQIGHLYHTPTGSKSITMSISESLHGDMVQDLLKRRPEISILIDTATDISTISSIAILFQTYDANQKVVVKLYRLIPAGRRESGENLFALFKAALEKDGLLDYVKEKCVGFASDGGSNMKKFRRLLEDWTTAPLLTVHCFAHKLDLALRHSWEEMDYLEDIDSTANGLYRIFNSKSHTKKALLHETAQQLGYKKFELKRIVPTRWINTKKRSLSTVVANWKVLVKATEAVVADRSTRRPTREAAKTLDSSLKDPTLIATMAFIADVCDELAAVSLSLQRRGITLISKKDMRNDLVTRLNRLKTTNGPRLQELLNNAFMPEDSNQRVEGVTEFETEDVMLHEVLLHPYEVDENSLQNQRGKYIEKIVTEIESYFPTDVTDDLYILDPQKWPSQDIQNFGNTQIIALNQQLRWNYPPAEILQSWIDIKTTVHASFDFATWKAKKPEEFWVHYLRAGSGITWPANIQNVITNVLVTPASTAEVERIFSLYSNVKTVQRYSLDVSTVEALIRIKFNGPKDPRDFDAARYARKFILQGHSRSNDESRRGSKRAFEAVDSDNDETAGTAASNTEQNLNLDDSDLQFDVESRNFQEIVFNGDEMEVATFEELEDDADSDEEF